MRRTCQQNRQKQISHRHRQKARCAASHRCIRTLICVYKRPTRPQSFLSRGKALFAKNIHLLTPERSINKKRYIPPVSPGILPRQSTAGMKPLQPGPTTPQQPPDTAEQKYN